MGSLENSPLQPKKDMPEQSQKDASWVENLAKRSTGLSADETPTTRADMRSDRPLWRLTGLGVEFALVTGLFAWIGHAADGHFGTGPWLMLTLILIALVGNLYLLIKEALRADSPAPGDRKKF